MRELPASIEARLRQLPTGLRDHIERAREVGRELAELHGVDADIVDLGIAAHDVARALKGDALLEQARHYRLNPHGVELRSPLLLHGPVAALWLEHEDGIVDQRVLEAVRWHTTGREGMGTPAKVVFLADKLDPQKVRQYPDLEAIRSLAERSLDRALLAFINQQLRYLLEMDHLIHPSSLELRNELIAVSGERE